MRFGVRLSPSGSTRADFILPVGSIEETITVYGTAALIGRARAGAVVRVEDLALQRVERTGEWIAGQSRLGGVRRRLKRDQAKPMERLKEKE